MTTQKILLLSSALLVCCRASATAFDSTTSLGSQTFIESVSGLGRFGSSDSAEKAKSGFLQWNLVYTFDRTTTVDPSTKISIVDKTSQVAAGLSWKDSKSWTIAAGLNYSVTPDENLRAIGPQVSAGYKYKFKPARGSDFTPAIGTKLTLATLSYTENFSASGIGRRKNHKPKVGKNQISQSLARMDLTSDVKSWLSLGAYASFYGYSRNVSDFTTYLDSSRAVGGQSAAGLSSTVAGLANSEQGVDFQIYFTDKWDFSARYSRGLIAEDHSVSSVVKGELSYDLTDSWSSGIGAEYDHLVGFNETLGLVALGYSF